MFTRRTATVTISAPDASIACRVSAKERYFPVPTMRREPYSRPARTNASVISAASHEMDDLDRVAVAERGRGVVVARHDGAVHLDGDAPRAETECRHELCHGRAGCERPRLVVHENLHATSRDDSGRLPR